MGGVVSPLLANIYAHYVIDLWVNQWRKREARGEVFIVRYSDDEVLGFEIRADAERCLDGLRERLRKFSLELHPEKTRLLEFGKNASRNRKRRGEGKPETFDFLGFTHICAKSRRGRFKLLRRTIAKRMRTKLSSIRLIFYSLKNNVVQLRPVTRRKSARGTTFRLTLQLLNWGFDHHVLISSFNRRVGGMIAPAA